MDDEATPWRTPARHSGGERARGTGGTADASGGNAASTMATTTTPTAPGGASASSQKRKRHAKKRRRSNSNGDGKTLKDDATSGKKSDTAEESTATAAESAEWGCPACTFLNDAARRFCEMCGTGNPTKPAAVETAPTEWSCVACTMMNAPSLRACAVCDTINPNAPMPSMLSIARRSLHSGLLLGGAGGIYGEGDDDDDDDDDDEDDSEGGEEDDSDGSSGSDDSSSSSGNADTDRRLECPCLECGVTIGAGQSACPECHAPHPFPRRKLKRSDLSTRLHKLARKVAKHDKSSKKKSKDSKTGSTKNAYGVSSEVLKKLLGEPKSAKLVDTLQALTHTLAMMDASADSEWGDMQGGGVSAFFVHGFGGSGRSDEGKDTAILGVLASVFRQDASQFSAEVRLFAVQSINYILKMDRHLFKKDDVLAVVRIYLGTLKQWASAIQSASDKKRRATKDEQMIVEECVNGLCGLCGSEGAMLRELVKPAALEDFLDFLTHLATDSENTIHSSVTSNTLDLLQKCCSKIKWEDAASPGIGVDASSSDVIREQASLKHAARIVDLMRTLLKQAQPTLHVSASKCLLLLFRRAPQNDQKQSIVSTLVTSDVILDLVAVLASKSVEEPNDSRQAAASLLMHLLDSRREMLEVFVQDKIYEPLLDGIQWLLLQATTSAALTNHSLKLVSLLVRRVHRAPSAEQHQPVKESKGIVNGYNRIRLDSSPDPDVLAILLVDFIRADSIPAVTALLKDGADLNFPSVYDQSGQELEKPLVLASEVASLAMVRFLVKRGADIHLAGPSGTALHAAALAGRCDVVSFLLECGASPTDIDRDGVSVLKRLDDADLSEGQSSANLVSPVRKLLELHQKVLEQGDSDESDDGGKISHGSSRRWLVSGEHHDFEDEDGGEFDEDDEEDYMDYDDAEDDNFDSDDDDDEMSSEDEAGDESIAHHNDKASGSHAERSKKKRRRESVGSDKNEGKSAKRTRASDGRHDETPTKKDASQRRRRSSSLGTGSDLVLATADEIDTFRSTVLRSLLKMLRGVGHQKVNRAVLSTLASAIEMASSKLIRSISDADISLMLETVNHLLQDPIMFTRNSRPAELEVVKPPAGTDDGQQTSDSSSLKLLQASLKATLASYILALRILQAIVRKSRRESAVFYEIERRGICEQIERLHAHSAPISRAERGVHGNESSDRTGIFGRGVQLLEFLRANMVESGMLHLHRLKNIARRLADLSEDSPTDERDMVLIDLVDLFEDDNSITSHEFKQSNLLEAILSFLVPTGLGDPVPTRVTMILDRFAKSPAAFNSLISRLHSVVNQEENLPLLSFFSGKGRELYPLTKQLKIVCTRAQHDSKDEPRLQKLLQLSALTHFQSFEKTIFRCMPVLDTKLASFYFSLIGHCIHKAVDGKWKKFWVCGFDQSRCMHLLKSVEDVSGDVAEIVLHDTQFKLSTALEVYAEVNLDFSAFGDAVGKDLPSDSASNGGDEKKRKRQKKRGKSSLTNNSGNEVAVEVQNGATTNAGKLRGAWYAGEIVGGADPDSDSTRNAVTEIQPGKVYNVRLLTSGNTLKDVPAEKIRLRNDVPQVGSVVDVDGLLGEVTRAESSQGNSEHDIFDVKISRDRERTGISKARIRYPPRGNNPSSVSSSGVIEAMSLSRLFPPRESSLVAGTIGDKVWVAPKPRAGENVADIFVAGTIHSFPAGSDAVGPAAAVFVEVSFGPSSSIIKVEQSRVKNLSNGRSRLGSSRLLSALNMTSERIGSSSGQSLQRLLQSTSAHNELFNNRPTSGAASAIDHLRQLLAHSSASRESSLANLLNSSSSDGISTASASTDLEADGRTKKKEEDASTHLKRVWKFLSPGEKKLYSKCIRPPKMNVVVRYERTENLDIVGTDRNYEEEFGLSSSLFPARRTGDSSLGEPTITNVDSETGETVLKREVSSALCEVFATFDQSDAATKAKSSKRDKKKQKVLNGKMKENFGAERAVSSEQTHPWNFEKFSAFMAAAMGVSKFDDPEGTLVDMCIQFSLFALPDSRRRLLDVQGFLASVTDTCKSSRSSRSLLAFLASRGYKFATMTGGTSKKRQADLPAASSPEMISSSAGVDQVAMRTFPSDQNMLKCLSEMQRGTAHTDSTPPWKLKYYVQCDVAIDWSNVVKRDPDASADCLQAEAISGMSHLRTINGDAPDSPMMKSIQLLSYLHEALPCALKVSDDVWRNARLSNKLESQLEDVLSVCSGIYPDWCDAIVSECKFFFPRELREKLFQATAFGCTRSLHWFRNQLNVDDTAGSSSNAATDSLANGPGIAGDGIYNHEITISPIPKERVKVNRENLLNSAEAVMKMHGKRKAILDIVFVGEKGYGSGVTAAFYSATAHALQSIEENQKEQSRCWVPGIENEREDESIRHPNGLFPFPYVGGSPPAKLVERFRMMGRLAGKALMDNRLFPLPLSVQFMKLVLGQRVTVEEVERVFLGPGKIIKDMKLAVDQIEAGIDSGSIKIDGMALSEWLDAVGFVFIDPLSQKPLMTKGDEKDVTVEDLKTFVDTVLSLWLHDGVRAQVQAFREGISDVLPVEKLNLLFVDELLSLLCGDADIAWDVESLMSTMKLAHGYTKDSQPVQYFVEVLAEMAVPQRREFLLYATGCPNLPAGGFASLRPPFEVVRRVVDTTNVDQSLPFARTCTNTLHLPAYSSKDVLNERLHYAIANSAGVIDRD